MKIHLKLLLYLFLTAIAVPELFSQLNNESQYVGVVDRIEENTAVILLEEIGKELILPVQTLGELAKKDQWLLIQMEERGPVILRSLPELKQERQGQINNLLKILTEKTSPNLGK